VLSIITRSGAPPRPRGHPSQRIGEKHLAIEALERGVDLEEQHPRIAQHPGGRLRLVLPAADLYLVRRGVVLHLHARFEMILARGHDGQLSDALPAAKGGQRRIRQHSAARRQFLMDPHEIPLAGVQKLEDLFAVGFRFLRPSDFRHLGGV
jgi:hypothetical protein